MNCVWGTMIWLIWLQQRFSKEATEVIFEAKEADLECQQETMGLIPIYQASFKTLLGREICQS